MVNIRRNMPSLLLGGLLFLIVGLVIITIFWLGSGAFEKVEQPSGGVSTGIITVSLLPTSDINTPTIAIPTTTPTPTNTPSPTPTITPTPTETPDPWIAELLSRMTLEDKIGQMLLIGVDGQAMNASTCELVQRLSPGGIVLRNANVVDPEQLRSFSADLQTCAESGIGIPLFIAIDHEGQYVTRFERGVTIFPAALALGATGDPDMAYQVALASGIEMYYSGVNMLLGPVADVLTNLDNTVISQRAFGGDPQLVSRFVAEAVRGYMEADLLPVLKHYPGHGGVAGDTHYEMVSDPVNNSILDQIYLPPFRSGLGAGAPLVMFSHVNYSVVDASGFPASLSPTLNSLLRQESGIEILTMTDSLGMAAVAASTNNISQAAIQAALAGEDLLLLTSPSTAQNAFSGLLEAAQSGSLTETRIDESVQRILALKAKWKLKSNPNQEKPQPNWEANKELSWQIARQAVGLLLDQSSLIPLPPAPQQILIVGPTDGWGLYPVLSDALRRNGYQHQLYTYSAPWSGPIAERAYLDSLPAQAQSYDIILALTWEAHLNNLRYNDNWQVELVNRFQATGVPLIVVALKSPTDIIEFPQISTYLATFGTTPGQIEALAEILVGDYQAKGVNPLPGLPLP